MKFVFLVLLIVLGLAASIALVGSQKELISHKKESALMRFDARDFPEHGVSLIVPSDPSFGHLLTKLESTSNHDPYSVLLKNSGTRAVVGYSINWQCFDDSRETSDRNLSNDRNFNKIVSWVFLHGKESDRKEAMNRSEDIIKPHSIWLISSDSARPVEGSRDAGAFSTTTVYESSEIKTMRDCVSMTVTVDAIFFDDGTFIGPDTSSFFTKVKSEMDARYEILRGVQNDLKSGRKADEIFKELERVRDLEAVRLGELATADEFRAFFRNLYARDVLGRKEFYGADKAIADIQLQLSKPWVTLRRL